MMTIAYSENDVFGDFPTKRQSSLLIESWTEIESQLDEVGIETFRKLFQAHSDIEAYFPSMKKLSSSDLEMARCVSAQFYQHRSKYSPISPECRKVREHSGRIMAVLRLFIGHLHDPGQVTGQLERLGQSRIIGWA